MAGSITNEPYIGRNSCRQTMAHQYHIAGPYGYIVVIFMVDAKVFRDPGVVENGPYKSVDMGNVNFAICTKPNAP